MARRRFATVRSSRTHSFACRLLTKDAGLAHAACGLRWSRQDSSRRDSAGTAQPRPKPAASRKAAKSAASAAVLPLAEIAGSLVATTLSLTLASVPSIATTVLASGHFDDTDMHLGSDATALEPTAVDLAADGMGSPSIGFAQHQSVIVVDHFFA
jgi:hypothetical protein